MNGLWVRAAWGLAFQAALIGPWAWGDEVLLTVGVRLRGEILRADAEKVVIRTPKGKELSYPRSKVRSIKQDEPEAFRRASQWIHRGDLEQAAKEYERFLSETDNAWRAETARVGLLQCYIRLREATDAARTYVEIIEQSPKSASMPHIPFFRDGDAVSNDFLDSLSERAGGLKASDAADAVRLLRCSGLASKARYDDAEAELRRVRQKARGRVKALANACQAQIWIGQGKHSQAIDLLDKTCTGRDESVSAWLHYWRGQAYWRAGEVRRAALAFLRAPLLDNDFRAVAGDCLYAAGTCFERLKQRERARAAYREVVEKYPTCWSFADAEKKVSSL